MDRSPVVWGFWAFDHVNAIHWTGVDTEIATGTIIDDHRMHEFSGPDNGIDRACLNALGTANAFFLNDECYRRRDQNQQQRARCHNPRSASPLLPHVESQ